MDVGHEGGQRNSEIHSEVQLLEYAISLLKEALDEKKELEWRYAFDTTAWYRSYYTIVPLT